MLVPESYLFVYEKNKQIGFSQNMLLTVDNPGAYNALSPIICALVEDDRCGHIIVIVSGVASEKFRNDFGEQFIQIRDGDLPFIVDLSVICEKYKPNIVICSVSETNGPEGIMLYAGKSVFGAEKLFLVCDGWGTLGSTFGDNRENMDMVDGFFCNDMFAERILERHLPKTRNSRFYVTGTPVIENMEVKKADEYRQTMRERFGLDEETLILLFLGDISCGYEKIFNSDPRINEITFEKTTVEMMAIAEAHPNKKFALVLRPHPRDANKQEMYKFIERMSLPQNLIFIDAGVAVMQMNEVSYGADVIASIVSTENLLAPLRGRRAIYLGYQGVGLGGAFLQTIYGKEIVNLLSRVQGVAIASSPEEFGKLFLAACSSKNLAVQKIKFQNPTKKILNIIFEETKVS